MKKKQFNFQLIIFITIEIIFTILVQLTGGLFNTVVSFTSVVCAFIFGLINLKKHNKLIVIGLFATVCADVFLVVMDPMKQNLAMCFFSITQISYLLYIYFNQTIKQRKIHISIRIAVIILSLLITIIVLKENTDFLSLISLFYYSNLIVNIIFSFVVKKRNLSLMIGLILFACCDLAIGLSIMGDSYLPLKEGTILYFIASPGFNLAWIFYVPSQTLIALSTKKDYTIPYM